MGLPRGKRPVEQDWGRKDGKRRDGQDGPKWPLLIHRWTTENVGSMATTKQTTETRVFVMGVGLFIMIVAKAKEKGRSEKILAESLLCLFALVETKHFVGIETLIWIRGK